MTASSVTNSGFCDQLYTTGASVANSVAKYSKIAGTAVLDGSKKVVGFAKIFFSMLGTYLGKTYTFMKGHAGAAYRAAKDFAVNNPRMAIALGIAFAAGYVFTAIFSKLTAASVANNVVDPAGT